MNGDISIVFMGFIKQFKTCGGHRLFFGGPIFHESSHLEAEAVHELDADQSGEAFPSSSGLGTCPGHILGGSSLLVRRI